MTTSTDEKTVLPGIKIRMLTILIVEDDLDDAEIIRETISEVDAAYAISCVDTGSKVIGYLAALKAEDLPALVILDYNMTPLTGIDVLNVLKGEERYRHIPVVIYSSSAFPRFREECLQAGACAYLTKSSSVQQVRDDIRLALSYCLYQ